MIFEIFNKLFSNLFSKLGILFVIKKKNYNSDYEIINKNIWIPFLKKKNWKRKLYYKSILKCKQLSTDNFSKYLRFNSLMQLVEFVLANKKLKTLNFAECGCWHGHSSYVISSLLKKHNYQNKFYIFDSFEGGLSNLSYKDHSYLGKLTNKEKEEQKKYFQSNEILVKKLLSPFKFIEIFKGWIPSRFNKIEGKKFQFVHLDVDLYQPTLDSLNFFYPRLEKGGVIICDDYNFSNFPGAKKAWDEYFSNKREITFFYEMPFGGSFIIK